MKGSQEMKLKWKVRMEGRKIIMESKREGKKGRKRGRIGLEERLRVQLE